MVVVACDQPEQTPPPEADPPVLLGADSLPSLVDSVVGPVLIDSLISVPLPPDVAIESAPALAEKLIADTGSVATPLELASLSGILDVPVRGVARADLRDSYSEARGERVHQAIDILAPRGTEVVSAVEGRLLKIFNSKPGGLMVYATDPTERFILLYGHLDGYAPGLVNGMPLKRGQVIGYVGTTGNAPPGTPHLHFGILRGQPKKSWSAGAAVNPYTLLVPVTSR